jgi:hypothetical protein
MPATKDEKKAAMSALVKSVIANKGAVRSALQRAGGAVPKRQLGEIVDAIEECERVGLTDRF